MAKKEKKAIQENGAISLNPENIDAASIFEIKNPQNIWAKILDIRASGGKIVFTNGCFDILHVGHLRYLKQAKAQGDFLVVGLNSDDSIRRLKGPKRPINNGIERMELLSALEPVDGVIEFNEDDPLALIMAIRPDILVKGGDWAPDKVVGKKEVESWGGRLYLADMVENRSTTGIIKKSQSIEREEGQERGQDIIQEKRQSTGLEKSPDMGCDRARENNKAAIIIPARYGSSRFPGKPLAMIQDKTMIAWVISQAKKVKNSDLVVVATDDIRIAEEAKKHGAIAIMTDKECKTGTDRVAQAAQKLGDHRIIINLQGDEPLIEPAIIQALIGAMMKDKSLKMATLATPFGEDEDKSDVMTAKLVLDKWDNALYFSRSIIPFAREKTDNNYLRHIGIYGYDMDFLLDFAKMPQTWAEKTESLEQLRALENGVKLRVIRVNYRGIGVDLPQDIAKVQALLKEKPGFIE